MEENKPPYLKFVVPISVISVIIIAAVAVYAAQRINSSETKQAAALEVTEINTNNETVSKDVSAYKDGTYEVIGNYVSPGGPRDIDVTITLKDGVITDSTFVGNATDPTSKRFQGEFAEGYKAMVIGKPIKDLALSKVSGSSLTPKGFNDALDKIREEAKS